MLIRADGSVSEIKSTQIPGRLSRLSEGKNVGLLLDYRDKFNPWAEARSGRRFSLYRRKKWKTIERNVKP